MAIPKIIHQLWVGPKPPPLRWMQTWQAYHPDWEYRLWDNRAVFTRRWLNQRHLQYYRRKKQWHGVSDIARYEILMQYGGFMPEADSECVHPVDELFADDRYDAYAVRENDEIAADLLSPLTAAAPGSPFAHALIDGLRQKLHVGEPWKTVGNRWMQQVADSRHWPGLKILPSHTFNPDHFTGHRYTGDGKIFAKQFWGTSHNLYGRVR